MAFRMQACVVVLFRLNSCPAASPSDVTMPLTTSARFRFCVLSSMTRLSVIIETNLATKPVRLLTSIRPPKLGSKRVNTRLKSVAKSVCVMVVLE